jgi:hypothetical protein
MFGRDEMEEKQSKDTEGFVNFQRMGLRFPAARGGG